MSRTIYQQIDNSPSKLDQILRSAELGQSLVAPFLAAGEKKKQREFEELSKEKDFQRQLQLQAAMGQLGGLKTGKISQAANGRPANVGAIPVEMGSDGVPTAAEQNASYIPVGQGSLIDPVENQNFQQLKLDKALAQRLREKRGEKDIDEEYKDPTILPSGVGVKTKKGKTTAFDIDIEGGGTVREMKEAAEERLRKIDLDKTLSAEERAFKRDQAMKDIDKANDLELEGVKQTGRETLAERVAAAEKKKPKTEFQAKAKANAAQALNATTKLDKLDSVDPTYFVPEIPYTAIGSERFKGADRKQFEQASYEFADAVLRFKTGASKTKEETMDTAKIWTRQPGDDAKTIAAKKESRDLIRKEMEEASGEAATLTTTGGGEKKLPSGKTYTVEQ